ncbi:MAG: hypothetical protein WD972_02935 [Candidatus Andersenbacteria bacterium]
MSTFKKNYIRLYRERAMIIDGEALGDFLKIIGLGICGALWYWLVAYTPVGPWLESLDPRVLPFPFFFVAAFFILGLMAAVFYGLMMAGFAMLAIGFLMLQLLFLGLQLTVIFPMQAVRIKPRL